MDAGDTDAVRALCNLGRNWPFMYKNTSDADIYALVERAAQKGYAVAQCAKTFITLAFVQDWTVKYNEGGNIGLVPEESGGPDKLGMYVLDKTGGGYEQDTVIADGPIIYGTGMNDPHSLFSS